MQQVTPAKEGAGDRLRAAGATAWSVVGLALVAIGAVLLLMLIRPLALALVAAVLIAIACAPLVDLMARHRVPRIAGAAVTTLLVLAVGVGAALLVWWGVASQWPEISANIDEAVRKLQSMLAPAGDADAAESAQRSVEGSLGTLAVGVLPALSNLFGNVINLAIGTFVALVTCFFLLRDAPSTTGRLVPWIPVRAGLRERVLTQATVTIRSYFLGLTMLGVFNAVVVGIGAWVLDVPLIGPIMVLTLLGSYVPYIGAFFSGAFAVLIALGSGGTDTALWMLLIVFLANGVLQTLITPFTFGAALNVSPLLLLLTAVLGGLLAGIVGVTLAAPVTAIVVHTYRLITSARSPDRDEGRTSTAA